MNKKMSRYKGLILSCVSMMMIVVCVCSFSFESKASAFVRNYAEPSTSDNQGYLIIESVDSSGNKYCHTFFWNGSAVDEYGQSIDTCVYLVIRANQLTISCNAPSNVNCKGEFSVGAYWNSGSLSVVHCKTFTNYSDYVYSYAGYTVVGFSYKGNVGNVENYISNNTTPTITFNQQDSAVKLQAMVNTLSSMAIDNDTIISRLTSIMNNTDTLEQKLQSLIDLQNQVLSEHKESNTWLEKIWSSIQEFLNPTDEDKQESEELENESTEKTDKLDDLNEQNKTDKTDIDSASNSVDENIDLDSIDNYGKVLSVITENQYILQILLLVFSVALVAYVLFGKK